MKIKFLRLYRVWLPGHVVDIGSGVAQVLIQRGIAEAVPADKPKAKAKAKTKTPRKKKRASKQTHNGSG